MTAQMKYKKVILAALFMAWLFPMVEDKLHLVGVEPLKGSFTLQKDTLFSLRTWFDGSFAAQKEKYINDQFALRPFFIRIKNQIYYSLYNSVSANDVVIGKDGVLFEEKYIRAYLGEDFVGEELLRKRFEKIKFVQDTLKKMNKDLILLFAPGKASFCPEFLPDKYSKKSAENNYDLSVKLAKSNGINFIDYGSLFRKIKSSSKHPLYPKTGTHWSIYGMYYAMDTLNRYIESKRNIKLGKFDYQEMLITDSLRDPDNDLESALNLLWKMPCYEMAYPINVKLDTAQKDKINLLMVSDSYWMGIYYTKIPREVYGYHSFWYYNNLVYDYYEGNEGKNPMLLDFKYELNRSDVICIMASEVNTSNIGWGFIEDAYKYFKYGEKSLGNRQEQSDINGIIRYLYENPAWLNDVRIKAEKNGMPLDTMIYLDAEWVYKQGKK